MSMLVRLLLLLVVLLPVHRATATEGARIAIVIGNTTYANATALPNATKDALAIASNLNTIGFDVDILLDKSAEELGRAIKRFKERVKRGGITASLIYYAGHGVEIAGKNYLVPVDAGILTEGGGVQNATELNTLIEEIQAGNQGITLAFIDACRNELVASRGGTADGRVAGTLQQRGIMREPPKQGDVVIAYATARAATASDGSSGHSPFTASLLKHMMVPDLPIERVLEQVTADVLSATGATQRPWVYMSKQAAFSLNRLNVAARSPGRVPSRADVEKRQCDAAYRDAVMSNEKLKTYREFLDKCPQHQRAAEVERVWLLEVEKTECEKLQGQSALLSDMQLYLQRYKDGGLCEATVKQRVAKATTQETAVRGPIGVLKPTPPEPPVRTCQTAGGSPFKVTGVRSDDVLNMRTGPSAADDVVYAIPADGTDIYKRTCNAAAKATWCEVVYDCRSGWVNASFLVQVAVARSRVVGVEAGDQLWIRPGPGDLSSKLGGLLPGTAGIEKFGCQQHGANQWCKIRYGSMTGWVNARYLD
jgi:uncharacterized protein YraI